MVGEVCFLVPAVPLQDELERVEADVGGIDVAGISERRVVHAEDLAPVVLLSGVVETEAGHVELDRPRLDRYLRGVADVVGCASDPPATGDELARTVVPDAHSPFSRERIVDDQPSLSANGSGYKYIKSKHF